MLINTVNILIIGPFIGYIIQGFILINQHITFEVKAVTYSVIDVSNFFIDYYSRSVDPMTLPRVQLFLYFAQAESLCRFDRPLFDDEIRAYPDGPAVTRLYYYYEGALREPIKVYKDYDVSVFSHEDHQLLMDVAIYYNMYSTSQLQIMTYAKGAPWEQVYPTGTNMPAISNDIIKAFYSPLPRIPNYLHHILGVMEGACETVGMPNLSIDNRIETSSAYTENEVQDTWE